MSTHENGPLLDGWRLPPRCCGEWATELACKVCGRHSRDIPANIELSEN